MQKVVEPFEIFLGAEMVVLLKLTCGEGGLLAYAKQTILELWIPKQTIQGFKISNSHHPTKKWV
jgi:hypothetical protein